MKRDPSAPQLSAVFVDYDNIYLSLKRRNEEAAKRFSKDAAVWLKAIEKGLLISSNGGIDTNTPRRIVLNRCYGNPVPRRNQSDNSTDMNSFPFVRHHFLRAGFEIVDCPPLTSQQKNAADIRMVMDLRDYLNHATYFDEFIILSGDADFTPVLHRLRQHARRTVIYSNDHTAAAYAAICDGEVREQDLIAALVDATMQIAAPSAPVAAPRPEAQAQPIVLQAAPAPAPVREVQPQPAPQAQPMQLRLEDLRLMVMGEVIAGIRAASGPVPLEALADRAIRALGHERTVGTAWAGAGSFRELMRMALPADLRLTDSPPFYAYDPQRHVLAAALQPVQPPSAPRPVAAAAPQPMAPMSAPTAPVGHVARQREALAAAMADLTQPEPVIPEPRQTEVRPSRYTQLRPSTGPVPRTVQNELPPAAQAAQRPVQVEAAPHRAPPARSMPPALPAAARADAAAATQATLMRVQEACQAPPLSASDYRVVFTALAGEVGENGLTGAQTLGAVAERAQANGVMLRREDVRFVLDVVSEPDPWFEQGATPTLFAGRFRNFVVARCRDHGLQLSAGELDLIDSWIVGAPAQAPRGFAPEPQRQIDPPRQPEVQPARDQGNRWWAVDETREPAEQRQAPIEAEDDFPRIVRARQRG